MKFKKITAIFLAVVFLVTACAPKAREDTPPSAIARRIIDSFSFSASNEDDAGVDITSAFKLLCENSLNEDDIQRMLNISPPAAYTLEKEKDGEYELRFIQELKKNTVYNVSLVSEAFGLERSFVFQTKRDFAVVSSYPEIGNDWVQLDSAIEINFSVADVNMEDYFTITPNVEGRFEQYNYTTVFIPNQPLAIAQDYVVTIAAGLPCKTGQTLEEDYILNFRTTDYDETTGRYLSPPYISHKDKFSETYIPGDPVIIEFYAYEIEKTFDVSLYRYEDLSAYRGALEELEDYSKLHNYREERFRLPTGGLRPVMRFEAGNASESYMYSYSNHIIIPEELDPGYYLAEVEITANNGDTMYLQKLIQISGISVYAHSLGGQTLFWLHDAVTGQPLGGAQVNLYGGFDDAPVRVTTDSAGIAQSEVSEQDFRFFTVETGGDVRYIDRLKMDGGENPGGAQMYASMCYKDREIYMPTDAIQVWGVLRQRKERFPLPEYVTVGLYQGWGWDATERVEISDPPLYSYQATLAPDGSYRAEIKHDSLKSGNYYIAVCTPEDMLIESSNVIISDYIKPDYIVSASLDKPFYTLGDDAVLDAEVTFFDGTPANDMRLHLSGYSNSQSEGNTYAVTDRQGRISVNLGRAADTSGDSWYPFYRTVQVISADSQNASAISYPTAVVVPRDIMLETDYTPGDYSGKMEITTTRVDTSGITAPEQIFEDDYKNIRGAPADIDVRIKIVRDDYVQDGVESTYYDFINKKTAYTYRYRNVTSTVRNETLRTSGGKLLLNDLPVPAGRESYEITISALDGAGRTVSASQYLYSNYNWNNPNYELCFDTGRSWGNQDYRLGDDIGLNIMSLGKPFDLTGKMLYMLTQDEIIKSDVVEGSQTTLQFTREMIPNVTLAGAFFDGRHIYPVSTYYGDSLYYNFEAEELNIEVAPDKERYRPGEEATLSVKLTDTSGAPVSGSLCVGVVDEAVFALQEQDIDPLGMLYRGVFSSRGLITYVSYIQHYPLMDGGKGGGGGDDAKDIRDEFVDTALFRSTVTDENGEAVISFTVPDNLTSWRVTAVAVDDETRAGKTMEKITSGLPYFVKPMLNRRYLEGEDVVLTAKVYGENADGVSVISVTPDSSEPMTKEVRMGDYAQFNLGKLPAGAYSVTIEAVGEAGGADAVRLPFSVVDSFMEIPLTQNLELSGISSLDSLRYPVTLAVFDREHRDFMDCIGRMVNYNPVRFEQKLGVAVAKDALERFSADYVLPDFADVPTDIAEAFSDPAQTPAIARACVAAPDYLPRGEVVEFLYGRLGDRESAEEWAAAAFMGLAAMLEPVLLDVREKLRKPELDFTQRLYYIAALAALGDGGGALSRYEEYVAPMLQNRSGQIWLEYPGVSNDVIYLQTSIAYFTALLTGRQEEATAMLRYFDAIGSDRYTCVLESAAYVTRFWPSGETGSRFAYTLDGKRSVVSLEAGRVKFLSFSRDSLAGTELEKINGDITAKAFYTAGPDSFAPIGERYVEIRKQASVPGRLQMGDLVKFDITVDFTGDAPEGWYRLTDFLPTNMRFFSGGNLNRWNGQWWNSQVFREQDQKLTLWIYYRPYGEYPTPSNYSFSYTGRVMYTGEYIAESAYLMHEYDLVAVRTPRQTLG